MRYYGVLRVKEYGTSPARQSYLRRLVHGAIMHGEQYLHDDQRRMLTTITRDRRRRSCDCFSHDHSNT